jgi:hypothetical protein
MRPLWIVAIVVCCVFAVASVASADLRDEVTSTAGASLALVGVVGDDPVPDPGDPSPVPDESESPVPEPEPSDVADEGNEVDDGDEADQPANHGAAVSAVAKDKDAAGTKELKNGKTITNHGQAVSAVARSGAGKPEKAGGNGKSGNGKSGGGKP